MIQTETLFFNNFFSLNFQVRWLNKIQGSSGNMRCQNWQILSVVCVAKKIIFLLLFKSSKFYNSADLEILFGFLCLSGERFKFFWKWRTFYNNAFLTFELPCCLPRIFLLRDWLYFVLIDIINLIGYCFQNWKRIFQQQKT